MSKIYLKNVGDIKVGKKYKNDHYPLTTYLGCGMRSSIFSSITVNKCLVIIEDAGNETVNDDGVTAYIGSIWADDNFEDFYLFGKNKPIKRKKLSF